MQLGEVGYWRAGPETERFTAMMSTVAKAKGLVLDCVAHIPHLLRQAGFMHSLEPTVIPLGRNGRRSQERDGRLPRR